MSFLEKNLDAINNCINDFKENYNNAKRTESDKVEVLMAKDGNKVLRVELGDKKVCLSSLYDGKKEVEHWLKQIEIKKRQVYLIFGLSNGQQIRELLRRMDKDSRIIVYEPSQEIFIEAMSKIDFTDIFESKKCFAIVKGINSAQFYDIFGLLVKWSNREAVQYISSVRYEQLFIEEYKTFISMLRDAQERIMVARNTNIFMADATVDAILFNLKYLYQSKSVVDLENIFEKECLGILVSSGPSLAKNIHLLKEAKGKAFILACDSAVKYLLKEGITPDAFVTLDVKKKYDFPDAKGLYIPGFVALTASTEITEEMDGEKVFFNSGDGYHSSICKMMGEPYYKSNTGGSVACSAFDLLRYMGCKNITLVGQDLAFINNQLYPGEEKDKYEGYQNIKLEEVEDIYGNIVYSDYSFTIYRRWFEKQIELYKGKVNVIDATEGGAKIKGSKIMSLREVIDAYCKNEYDFLSIFQNLPIHFNEDKGEVYVEWVLDAKKRIKRLKENINRAIDICNRFIVLVKRKQYDGKELKRIVNELGTIVEKIDKIPEKKLVELYATDAVYYATEQLEEKGESVEQEQLIVANRNLLLYKRMGETLTYLEEQYEKVFCEFSSLYKQ